MSGRGDFRKALGKEILVLDGSMGALLQSRGLPAGMAPDVWMMDSEAPILGAHQEYVNAGADIILTNTFGASRLRLAEYQAEGRIREINARAVEIARKAAGDRAWVAGDIGPSGETIYPTGKRAFDEIAAIFYEQAKILVELGVDLIVVETLFDSLEFRAALSGVRAASLSMPVLAHATFNTDGLTDTGASPDNIAAIAEGFHVDGVGLNCSTGPAPMVEVLKRMFQVSRLPLSVQPNAGLPQLKDGRTQFPMNPDDMEVFIDPFIEAGAAVIGGCCGTVPEFIRRVKERVRGRRPIERIAKTPRVLVSSLSRSVSLGSQSRFLPIGEKMNPSGRKKLSESLKSGSLELLLQDADLQFECGARILDLNVGVPLVDEAQLMLEAVVSVQNRVPLPLMIDSSNTWALDRGAAVYYGRPLLNSLNAEEEKLVEAIPVVKKHGAAVVCMTTGTEVPVLGIDRLKNAQKIAKLLIEKHGFREEDLVFDCLGLVVSAMREGARETLNTIALVKEYFPGSATTLGLSNVSFGLPNRAVVNGAFLSAAVQHGLDSAIMSVSEPMLAALGAASEMFGKKENAISDFMDGYSKKLDLGANSESKAGANKSPVPSSGPAIPPEPVFVKELTSREQEIFRAVVDGEKAQLESLLKNLISEIPESDNKAAMHVFLEVMTPAIRYLGDLFGARVKFIPHLMASAEAMKVGVALLEPLLLRARQFSGEDSKGIVIFATVKGDIHDIGKNICILMLRNFGYEVVDLGRNVDSELILQTAIEKKASVIALSALMTTTMMQMKVVIDAVKERGLPFKVVIGGAVVTPEFAKEIQADGYSTDVGTVVSEMERVIAILRATA